MIAKIDGHSEWNETTQIGQRHRNARPYEFKTFQRIERRTFRAQYTREIDASMWCVSC